MTSTHTHAGPDVVGIWGRDYSESGIDNVYMDFLISTAAAKIKKTLKISKMQKPIPPKPPLVNLG